MLRGLVGTEFDLVRESTSPVEWLGPQLGTQRWLIARKRAVATECRSADASSSAASASEEAKASALHASPHASQERVA